MTQPTGGGSVVLQSTGGRSSSAQVLVIACAGVVLASLDLFIVNVALPDIARDLHNPNLSELSWVLNAYAIVYASLLVFFGRLADRYRRDRAFVLGVAVFTAASAACAASTSVAMLVAFRVVQAAGAALVTPTSLSLVLASYESPRRSRAVRAWTAVGGLAAAIGPVVGGLLVGASWRWVFLVNVPFGIVAVVAGLRRLPEIPGHPIDRPDPIGVLLVTGGVGLLTFGLVQGPAWGWSSLGVVGVMGVAAVLLASFVVRCRHSTNPLVRPELFRSRNFSGASVLAFVFSAAFGGMLLSIVLWMQDAWGWSALRTGLGIAPGPLMVPLISFLVAGRLIRRFGAGAVIVLGSVAFAVGRAWWAVAVTTHPDYVSGVLAGMILGGVGTGLVLPTMMGAATSSLPPSSFATGSAVVNMIRQAGLALGVALLVAVVGTGTGHAADELGSFQRAWWIIAAVAFTGVVPAFVALERRHSTTSASLGLDDR